MSKPNVVDSSGWIEFFTAGKNGPYFRPVIADIENVVVPTVAIYEVHKRLSQLIDQESVDTCIAIMQRGKVAALDATRAIAASRISQQYKLAMADAVMYGIALEHEALFWTQDVDYQGLPQVNFQAKT